MHGLKNNTLEAVWDWFCLQVSVLYGINEAQALGREIFEHFLKISPTDRIINKEMRLGESQIVMIYKAISKLRNNIPIQYITGRAHFRDFAVKVNSVVLIPRNETEELVQWIVDDSSGNDNTYKKYPAIWDIGTGSGIIAISLAREIKNASVFASDVSNSTLAVARENGKINAADVSFFQHDILIDPLPQRKFDIIVSNPPYVRESEKNLMHKNVLDYEPALALFVPDEDPLRFYKAIAKVACSALNTPGSVYFEINEALGNEICTLLDEMHFKSIELRKDINGKDRFVKVVKI